MTIRVAGSLLSGKFHIGFRGLGVLGSQIASTGTDGPGFGYPSVEVADANAELWFEILTQPAGTLVANEDTSFTYSGPASSFTFRKWRNGVDMGTGTATLNTGTAMPLVSSDLTLSYSVESMGVASSDLTLSYTVNALSFVSSDLALSYAVQAMSYVSSDLALSYAVLNGSTMSFQPSAARTITVNAASRAFTVQTPGYWDATNPKKPKGIKDPHATLDFSFDWSDWLLDCKDSIASVAWNLGGGMKNEGDSEAAGLATVFVSGGIAGEANVSCRITTTSVPPRTEERTVMLIIEDR